jgi:CheY-like chemotaxis protein
LEPEAGGAEQARVRRLLVVDDEEAMRLLLRVNLPLSGFEVVEAANGHDALELARRERFDLVLLDVMLPGMSGIEVAEELRRDPRTAHVPVVFVSARADSTDVERGYAAGAVDYVTKPFDPIAIGDQLGALIAASASRYESV